MLRLPKSCRRLLGRGLDFSITPFVFASGLILRFIRTLGIVRFPLSKTALLTAGVFPITNHYYEPRFDFRRMRRRPEEERPLPGIDWNVDGQLRFLERLAFADELAGFPKHKTGDLEPYMYNQMFGPGDAEYWYQILRALKPKRVIEIGSGGSTLVAIKALSRNHMENAAYSCDHVCIEPFEAPWLEKTGVRVVRCPAEEADPSLFCSLDAGDILFIDSSHMIRPQGDVLFEYLELLPTLKPGVIVHVHDIFSPRDYPRDWLADHVKFWNEQYLLEAFLSHNADWEILGALNFLHHHHYEKLQAVCPFLWRELNPGSFYLRKVA